MPNASLSSMSVASGSSATLAPRRAVTAGSGNATGFGLPSPGNPPAESSSCTSFSRAFCTSASPMKNFPAIRTPSQKRASVLSDSHRGIATREGHDATGDVSVLPDTFDVEVDDATGMPSARARDAQLPPDGRTLAVDPHRPDPRIMAPRRRRSWATLVDVTAAVVDLSVGLVCAGRCYDSHATGADTGVRLKPDTTYPWVARTTGRAEGCPSWNSIESTP